MFVYTHFCSFGKRPPDRGPAGSSGNGSVVADCVRTSGLAVSDSVITGDIMPWLRIKHRHGILAATGVADRNFCASFLTRLLARSFDHGARDYSA